MPNFTITSAAALNLLVHAKQVRAGQIEGDKVAFAELEHELQGFASRLRPFTLEWADGHGAYEWLSQVGWTILYKPYTRGNDDLQTVIFNDDTGRSYTLRGDHRDTFKLAAESGWEGIFKAYKILQPTHGFSFEG
jgi:hypothetical protein